MQLKETFILIGVWRPKMSYFGLQTREKNGKKRKKEGEEEEEGEAKSRYGIFVWIHDFCMDFGMLFVYKLLGYDC